MLFRSDIYSRDENLWHISHEGGNLENPWHAHTPDVYKWCVSPENAPNVPKEIVLTFEKGVPVALDGVVMNPVALISELNKIGGEHGVGIVDIVENRLVGMKSRGVYETPGGTLIHQAHKSIEKLVLDRQTMGFKKMIGQKYADMVYDGQWFSPLKKALDAFIDATQVNVTGDAKLKLYKGSCQTVATKSPYSLYNEQFVTFGEDEVYNQKDAEGFINLFTLPLKIKAIMERDQKSEDTMISEIYALEPSKVKTYGLEDVAV